MTTLTTTEQVAPASGPEQRALRCLLIYPYCNLGGVASVVKQRIRRLSGEVTFTAAFRDDAGGKTDWERHGVEVLILGAGFTSDAARLAVAEDVDVVAVFDSPDVASLIRRYTDVRLIYEVHTPMISRIRESAPVVAQADLTIVPSIWSRQRLVEFGADPSRIVVVPNFVDETLFHPSAVANRPLPQHVMWVGKISSYKNWRDALATFSLLHQLDESLRFRMLTGGRPSEQDLNEFLRMMDELRLTDVVDWIHNVPYDRMPAVYGAARDAGGVLLITSDAESFCMVLHEAWHCGVPVVASDVGPIGEFIADGANGRIFRPHDILSASHAVMELLQDEALRRTIRDRAALDVAAYDSPAHVETYHRALLGK